MLLASLFLVMGTAWAQTAYTVSATTGTGNKSGYFATWSYTTSDANPAALKLAVQGGANNMQIVENQLQLWVGSGCTYTLQVPVFYRIVSYSFDFVKVSDYTETVTLTVDGKEYNPTMETQSVTVNNINQSSTAFKLTGANKGIKVTNFVVNVDCAFEVTTDETKPIWHTIKNVRGNVYAYNDGDSRSIGLSNAVANGAYLFYFTAGTTAGTYKIHSYVTSKKCADFNSWTDAGNDWYITPSANTEKPGWAITKNADHTGGWNNAGNSNTYVAGFSGDDIGSTWEIARYDYESVLPTVLLSTAEKKVLHYIRSIRRDSYVNFDGHNVTFKEGNLGLASYWYFVQDEEAQKNAPEGFLACRIFNAAHATGVENHSSGYMGDGSWPARVYYIGTGGYERYGYLIYRADANLDNNGYGWWHDKAGESIMDYHKNDVGSYWRIYPADKTEEQLKSEAATAKTNALNTIATCESADYYTYSDENIAVAKTTINATTNDNLLNATSGWMTVNKAIATLEATEKSAAPVAGDYIQLKNKHHNKYLKALESDAEGVDSKADLATIWKVVDGANGNVKLKNVSTEKYIGQVRQSATVAMTDEANAAEFSWTNQDKVYAVFKDVTGGDYAYGHVNGGKLVGWLPDAASSQWVVSQAYPLTVVYMYNGEEIAEHKVETYFSKGDTYTINNPYANSKKYVTLGTCTATGSQPVEADGTWSVKVTEATSITVTIVDDLPFKVSESYAEATWYYMNIRSNDKKYVAMSDATEYSNVAKPAADDKSLWAFMGDANGIQIINKAAGDRKTLSFEGDAAGDKAVVMREEEKTWTIERAATGFLLRAGNEGNLYVHDLGGKLKIWNSTSAPTDEGSAFNVVEDKGVKSLEELANPRYINIYTIQAERSPLMYSATETTMLSSGMLDGVAANENDVNQQFLILRTASTPENYFYLYSLGAEKFVDETLKFIDYPAPVLSFEASNHTVYPWRVKVDNKYVIPSNSGNDGNKIYHVTGGDDDEGKRFRIIKVGESYDYYPLLSKIEEAEDMIKLTSELSNAKVYTVSTFDEGYWYYNSEQNALWSTEKAGVEPSSQDINLQFAFLSVAGHTYLYSMGAQKFVVKAGDNTAYSNVPSQSIELLDAEGSRFYPFVAAFVDGDNRHHIGISNGHNIPVITNWNDLNDNGNKIKLREVTPGYMAEGAAELLAAAVTQIDNYLAAQELKPELAAKIAEVQALLDKNYLDTEDATALTSAKNAAQAVYDEPTSGSVALTEQIDLLAAAIDEVTYVREIADFKNCYVYTFVSKRGWMVATDANTVKSADEGAANNPLHQWAVYKSANNNYYLYNIGKQQFMGFVNTGGAKIPFAETPQMTTLTFKKSNWADYPIMFSVDNVGAVNNDMYGDMKYWDGGSNNGWNNLEDDGNNHKVTIVGAVPSATLAAIESRVATHELDVAIAAVQAKVDVMNKLGYYSSSNENIEADFNAIKDFKAAIDTETTVDAINAQTTAANNLVATFTVLNVPQAGKFYRIKNNGGTGYLNGNGTSGRAKFDGGENDANSVFYYVGGKLLSYKTGTYLAAKIPSGKNANFLCYTEELNVGTDITFKESPALGKLLIVFDNESRSFYSASTGESDAAGAGNNGDNYRFIVEEVTVLPVTITAAQVSIKNEVEESETKCISTFYAPVALEVPAGVTACTGQAVDNYLALTAIEGVGEEPAVIPANTGVILLANAANTYNFSIYNGDEVSGFSEENNHIKGSVAKTLVAPEEGYNCYVLAQKDETVGLYRASLNKNASNQSGDTHFINNACKAYIPVQKPAVEEPAQAARALTMRFSRGGNEGTTSVEGLELDAQGEQLIYDLAGRRVLNPTKGMYIVNGKKVVIK